MLADGELVPASARRGQRTDHLGPTFCAYPSLGQLVAQERAPVRAPTVRGSVPPARAGYPSHRCHVAYRAPTTTGGAACGSGHFNQILWAITMMRSMTEGSVVIA
jgi:hypothetical protein